MADKLAVYNMALLALGDSPLQSLTDDGAGRIALDAFYQTTVEAFFTEYPWHFAVKKVKLSRAPDPLTSPLRDDTITTNGYRYAFHLPADFIKTWKVNNAEQVDFEIVGKEIRTDRREIILDYVGETTEADWPAYVTRAIAAQLAADVCMNVSEDRTLAAQLNGNADYLTKRARTMDARQRPNKRIVNRPFIDARYTTIRQGR